MEFTQPCELHFFSSGCAFSDRNTHKRQAWSCSAFRRRASKACVTRPSTHLSVGRVLTCSRLSIVPRSFHIELRDDRKRLLCSIRCHGGSLCLFFGSSPSCSRRVASNRRDKSCANRRTRRTRTALRAETIGRIRKLYFSRVLISAAIGAALGALTWTVWRGGVWFIG